jgi:hypothetical protein
MSAASVPTATPLPPNEQRKPSSLKLTPQQQKVQTILQRLSRSFNTKRKEFVLSALRESLLLRMKTLYGDRIITTHPYRVVADQQRTSAGLYMPQQSMQLREVLDTLYVVTVLRVGSAIQIDDVKPGDEILIPACVGGTLHDTVAGREVPLGS